MIILRLKLTIHMPNRCNNITPAPEYFQLRHTGHVQLRSNNLLKAVIPRGGTLALQTHRLNKHAHKVQPQLARGLATAFAFTAARVLTTVNNSASLRPLAFSNKRARLRCLL